jgi:hypothetical protein
MSKLLIESLTEQVSQEVTKTAEEAEMEKLAYVANVVEQAQALSLVGEELYKIAEELENDEFAALAADTYQLGERMGACLTKTASDSGVALDEAMEIAEDLNKIAEVIADIADEVANEDFNKLAETVIGISNEMTDEANEIMETIEKDEELQKEAKLHGFGHAFRRVAKETKDAFSAKGLRGEVGKRVAQSEVALAHGKGEKMSKLEALKDIFKNHKTPEGRVVKDNKSAVKSLKAPGIAYGSAAAALAGAGYAAKKHSEK